MKDTTALKSAVNAYLMATAYAQTIREKVDEIERDVLAQCPLKVAEEWKDGLGDIPELITDPKYVYLADLQSEEYKEHMNENRKRQEEAGLRKNIKNPDFCPALVAESLVRQTKRLIVEIGADFIERPELTPDKLLSSGLKNYNKFVDLCCSLIVNEPGYKSPL